MADKATGRNYKRFACQMLSIVFLVGVDHIIKFFAERDLKPTVSYELIPGFLGLHYAQNTGAAFSFMSGMTAQLSVITGGALLGMVFYLFFTKNNNRFYHILFPLVISGGVGNLIDRVTRGYVVDYFEFLFLRFAIFNFADILVTCSAAVLIAYLIYDAVREYRKERTQKQQHEPA
ncbi:MAG: signal peptidase II [Oscillospiraceae bacterium]|jgi:signal peptidase II|nr:signal peptidase II [Oscillospiraceae bacterium]